MRRRHPLPRLWLMTDARMGDALWDALARLPRGAGVVFRHYGLPDKARRVLLDEIARVARRRGLILLVAGREGPDGRHNQRPRRGLHSRSAHHRRDIVSAQRAGADLVFVSPVFPTRSHHGAGALGVVRLGLMIRGVRIPIVVLGGMNARRARGLSRMGIYGWAGIDAWTRSSGAK